MYMEINKKTIRNYRLRAHHLDSRLPLDGMIQASGACGLQNSPPGAWETALFNRLEGCTLKHLRDALHIKKSLLQAWSFRGVPLVFPTEEADVFLTSLIARKGEEPWIYTRGITAALDYVQMSFVECLALVTEAAAWLDTHTITTKDALDETLAAIIQVALPQEKQDLWNAPSMYGKPDRQTVGGAIVSFLLRPCSFSSLVVFGERMGTSPTFTSMKNWTGQMTEVQADSDKALVRKFLHCYGPATINSFTRWLGCSPRQARRLWDTVADEVTAVKAEGKICYMLSKDMVALLADVNEKERFLLLGAHDPYLDIADKAVLLEDTALQRQVWKTVANPGAILRDGRVIGIWKTKTVKDKLDLTLSLFEPLERRDAHTLEALALEYAAFRRLTLGSCTVQQ